MEQLFENIGVAVPDILLPNTSVDMKKWAVVACDQYTSQPEYWENAAKIANWSPSTLNIIYPEVYLEEENNEQRIHNIHTTMKSYVETVVQSLWAGFILLDRQTSHTASRKGLIVALDLEHYDYSVWSQTLIRATEWTILDRLPPRIKIRNWAPIESPHIMVLIDDEHRTVIEPLFADVANFSKVYDTDLMLDGWHITWYHINDMTKIQSVITALSQLANPSTFQKKYSVGDDKWVLLFAMGDGNHSFATAKAIWEEKKKTLSLDEQKNHPARFALVELVNIHDTGLVFEPIHRVLFDVHHETLFAEMHTFFKEQWSEIQITTYTDKEEMKKNLKKSDADHHYLWFTYDNIFGILDIVHPKLTLEVGNLQAFLDLYLSQHPTTKIDYVHGEDTTQTLWSKPGNIWFLLPIMDKNDFFKTVIVDWALPRKTFSMGEAEEKRFYLECRKIEPTA